MLWLITLLSLLVSLSWHELCHGWVAAKLGDPTAKWSGRLTLNPLAHIDPVGTVLLPLVLLLSGSPLVVGWAKPVPINPLNFKNYRPDLAKVALAGPGGNILLAIILSGGLRLVGVDGWWGLVLLSLIKFNLGLAVFNLIPLGPLDGFKVVYGLLPFNLAADWGLTERWGIFALLLLMLTPAFNTLIFTPVSFLLRLLLIGL